MTNKVARWQNFIPSLSLDCARVEDVEAQSIFCHLATLNTVYVEYNKRRLVHYLNEDNDCEIVAGKVNVFFALGMLNVTLQAWLSDGYSRIF